MNARLHPPAIWLGFLLVLVIGLCAAFGWWQNQAERLGGSISPAKSLWLATALGCFYLVPAVLWRDESLGAPLRRLTGGFLAGFVARAVVEVPVLLVTNGWRCWHGLLHDVVMLGWLLMGALRLPRSGGAPDAAARRVLPLLGAALIFEMTNAWLFQAVARPQDGVYFADETERFLLINRLTWIELAVLWPLLVSWLWRYASSIRIHSVPDTPATTL